MALNKSLVEVTHDEGYGDSLLMHINLAFGGKDMRADKIVNPVASALQIEGIPEGWEFVRIGGVKRGEFRLGCQGQPLEWTDSRDSASVNYVVIRKKQKRYRHFENAAEADSMWNAVLRFKHPAPGLEDSKFRVSFITVNTVGIGNGSNSYKDAFESFECIDGTPFGVEVTE